MLVQILSDIKMSGDLVIANLCKIEPYISDYPYLMNKCKYLKYKVWLKYNVDDRVYFSAKDYYRVYIKQKSTESIINKQ